MQNKVIEKIRTDLIEEKKDFIDIFVNVIDKNLALFFTKNRDIQVADSIIYLFKTRENIENYNKKAIIDSGTLPWQVTSKTYPGRICSMVRERS